MTTQVYNNDTTQSFIGYHKNTVPTAFGTYPYQILAHQPSDAENCWKYNVIVADLTNLETEKQFSTIFNKYKAYKSGVTDTTNEG